MKEKEIEGVLLYELEPGDLERLAKEAGARFEGFEEAVASFMTPGRAAYIRKIRVDEGYSWRGVALACYNAWPEVDKEATAWYPESNQLMGMALCQAAAREHDEDYMAAPWNG